MVNLFPNLSFHIFIWSLLQLRFKDYVQHFVKFEKIKKSEHTGSGSADVYVPKWKFFNECMFLEDIVASNRPQCTNLRVGLLMGNEDDEDDILDKELHATETARVVI